MDIDKIIREVTAQVGGTTTVSAAHMPVYSPEITVTGAGKTADIISRLEHSMLNPDLSVAKLEEAARIARKYGVAALCVSPYFVPRAVELLRGSNVAVDAAVGFPHGAISTAAKIAEAKECIRNGATELDVAINILAVKA